MSQTRRLAAILAADVSGYSRLIGVDEGGTLRHLKAIRAELMDPKIAEHNGRLVKTTGDGFLVEFGSVVDALRCASELQAGMAERNTEIAADRRIEFRIGINVGDVVVEDGDIFGDGVNVAARLEGLADPGGICVSALAEGCRRQARYRLRGFMSVGACRRCGRKTTPIRSRACARPDGGTEAARRSRCRGSLHCGPPSIVMDRARTVVRGTRLSAPYVQSRLISELDDLSIAPLGGHTDQSTGEDIV